MYEHREKRLSVCVYEHSEKCLSVCVYEHSEKRLSVYDQTRRASMGRRRRPKCELLKLSLTSISKDGLFSKHVFKSV